MSSDLGAVAKDMASAVARGAEKGGKAIIEHYKSIGEGLLKSSALHKEVDDAAKESAENIGKKVGEDVGKDAAQAGEKAGKDAGKGIGSRIKNGLKRVFGKKGAEDEAAARDAEGDPVDLATGDVLLTETDVSLPGVLRLVLERTHRSSMDTGRWFGPSWMSSLDQRLLVTSDRVIGAFAGGRVLNWPPPTAARDTVSPASGPLWPLQRDRDGSYSVVDPQRGLTWRFESRDGYEAADEGDLELPLVSVTDRVGHEIAFHYDAAGQPLRVTHSGGYCVLITVEDGHVTGLTLAGRDGEDDMLLRQFTYDDDGNLSGVVNSSGLPLRYTYDAEGRMTGWTDRNGHYYRYAYDAEGRCISGDGPDRTLSGSFTYEPGITRWTDSTGAVTTYEITESGQLAATIDPLGNTTRREYDDRGNLITRIDPLGRITRYTYDDRGNLITITLPDGSQATAEYDGRCLPVLLTDPDGTIWRQKYDERGNRTLLEAPDGSVTRFAYDDLGHLTKITAPDGRITSIACDKIGLPIEVVRPGGAQTHYETDMAGRITRTIGPDGSATTLSWTPEGKPATRTFPDGAAESWEWDGEGNLARHTSPSGAITSYQYGPFDKVTDVHWPDGRRAAFAYDHKLRISSVEHGDLTWRYDYDAGGRLSAETDYNGASTTYEYDSAGQLTRKVNAVGQDITFSYDLLGNMIERTTDGEVTTFAYDESSRVIRASNADADLRFERDALGRVTAETCNDRLTATSYDTIGRITSQVTPSGAGTDWDFDEVGRPTKMTTGGHQLHFGYDVNNRETIRELPGGAALSQEWDHRGRLTNQSLTGPTGQLQHRSYHYRADGFPEHIDDLLAGNQALTLDASGRITSVNGTGWDEQYTYDQAGTIIAATIPPPPTEAAAAWSDACGPGPRQKATGTLITRAGNIRYHHDAAGRVVTRTRTRVSRRPDRWRYEWNADNQLISVVTPDGMTWSYHYDPFGRRISKRQLSSDGEVLSETQFTWNGAVLAEQAETRNDEELIITWAYRPGTFVPIAQAEHTCLHSAPQEEIDHRFYSIITDLVGMPTELTGTDGTLVGHQQRTLWGSAAWGSDGAATPLRFPGQYEDPETGLYYNNQRYYDPVAFGYISPDPLGLAPAPNPHSYVPNPHVLADPLGLSPQDPHYDEWSSHYESAHDATTNYHEGQSTRDPSSQWYHEYLSDDELIDSINNAPKGDGLAVSHGGTILGGHHRWDELKTRVGDGRISPDKQIRVDVFEGE